MESQVYLNIILFVFLGATFGSFFNVVIYRFPLGLSVVSPPSACPGCQSVIKWYDNIPVLGWIQLLGKCRNCKIPISIQYPLVELLCAVLTGLGPLLAYYLNKDFVWGASLGLFLLVCVPIVWIDIKHFLIPDMIVIPAAIVVLVFKAYIDIDLFWAAAKGVAIGAGGLWLFSYLVSKAIKKDAMGLGDVKLMILIGALVGSLGAWGAVVIAALSGLLFSGVQKSLKKQHDEGWIPFGPFLCLGCLVFLVWGDSLIELYLTWLGIS
jgi:leader peptidase (prepilin peptidase) / N-methyltransferase